MSIFLGLHTRELGSKQPLEDYGVGGLYLYVSPQKLYYVEELKLRI